VSRDRQAHAIVPVDPAQLAAVRKNIEDLPSEARGGPLLFWGQDRLELVARAIARWRPGAE
jgi:hypothetical protein